MILFCSSGKMAKCRGRQANANSGQCMALEYVLMVTILPSGKKQTTSTGFNRIITVRMRNICISKENEGSEIRERGRLLLDRQGQGFGCKSLGQIGSDQWDQF